MFLDTQDLFTLFTTWGWKCRYSKPLYQIPLLTCDSDNEQKLPFIAIRIPSKMVLGKCFKYKHFRFIPATLHQSDFQVVGVCTNQISKWLADEFVQSYTDETCLIPNCVLLRNVKNFFLYCNCEKFFFICF